MKKQIERAKPKVLFIDDEIALLEALARTFRASPFEVCTAHTARQGKELLGVIDVDVVVADELMPEMRGTEFLEALKGDYPWIARIMLTGNSTFSTVHKAINRGEVLRFYSKPYNKTELLAGILDGIAYSQEMRNSRNLNAHQAQECVQLLQKHPGIFEVKRDAKGVIVIDKEEVK